MYNADADTGMEVGYLRVTRDKVEIDLIVEMMEVAGPPSLNAPCSFSVFLYPLKKEKEKRKTQARLRKVRKIRISCDIRVVGGLEDLSCDRRYKLFRLLTVRSRT